MLPKVSVLALVVALFRDGSRRYAVPDDDGHCRVCDHPFGDLKHACL